MPLLVFLVLLGCGYYFFAGIPNKNLKTSTLTIGGKSIKVEIADNPATRARGLSFRESLEEGYGMYFLFDSAGQPSFWMKDMNFPIDIIWIKDDRVVNIESNASPQPGAQLWQLKLFAPAGDINRVLEVNAGWAERNGVKAGDSVRLAQE